MSGSSSFFKIILSCLIALAAVEAHAQSGSSRLGPVVNAYLTGLQEEFDELEFQLAHKEILRVDYDLAKRRLQVIKRFVEAYAASSQEDLVPEFQVLADDELAMLGLKEKPEANSLVQGQILGNQWRLASIERGKPRFFVFELMNQAGRRKTNGLDSAGALASGINPVDVIETIVVPESVPLVAKRRVPEPQAPTERPGTDPGPPVRYEPPQWKSPQIIFIYLPQLNDRAIYSRIEGEVVVSAVFHADGRVTDARVEKGLGHGLDQRSLDSVRRIGFIPGQRQGIDVDTSVQVTFVFTRGKVNFYVKSQDEGGEPHQLKGQSQ